MSTLDELSFSAKSALIALRPAELRTTWEVGGTTDLSDVPGLAGRRGRDPISRALGCFGRPRRRTDEVWGVSMVRDEIDVIRYTVEHLFAEGVDRVLIADNGSVDGTAELLREMASDFPITVVDDTLRAYYQGVKMTRLARVAASAGAAWVIPFDADELWYSPDGRRLADALRDAPCDVLAAPMWNQVPGDGDGDDPNPYLRLRHRTKEPLPMPKVAFRAHVWARLAPGNHAVRHPAGRREALLGIRQVPFRSVGQVERKYRNGLEALEASSLTVELGAHWRELGSLPTDEMVERVSERDQEGGTIVDPAPYRPLPSKRVSG
jgi:hypothetical protein